MMRAQFIMNAADFALALSSYALKCDYSQILFEEKSDNHAIQILRKLLNHIPAREKRINPKSI